MALKLDLYIRVLEYYQDCSNDAMEPRLRLERFPLPGAEGWGGAWERGRLGRSIVLGNCQCRGVLFACIWIKVGQGPTVLAIGADMGCLTFFLSFIFFSFLFLGDGSV